MKTKSYHYTILGCYTPGSAKRDSEGYVTYHDSPRYAGATAGQLDEWSESRTTAVHNAAVTEIAERALKIWQSA